MDERTFSTREAARLLDLAPHDVRRFARAGLDSPRRGGRNEYRFGFRDLVVLRMAARLRRAEVPAPRILAALERLRGAGETPVAGLRLEALGSHVVVRDGEVVWRADSDQLQLSLDPPRPPPGATPAAPVLPGSRAGAPAPAAAPADGEPPSPREAVAELVERASRLENDDPGAAIALYERAARIEPACWEAHAGAGFLRQQAGDLAGAVVDYERAQALEPDPTVAFNLGLALGDLGRTEEAISAYRGALALEPGLADAHFNLSLLHERRGDRTAALRHMIAYREGTRDA